MSKSTLPSMSSCRLQHPQADFGMHGTELGKRQAAKVKGSMQTQLQQHRARRLQLRGRIGDVPKARGYFGQEDLAGRCQNELLVQPLEQTHAEPRLQGFRLLSDGGRCHMQLVRSQLETEMSRRGFECAERIKRWEAVGHRRPVCH